MSTAIETIQHLLKQQDYHEVIGLCESSLSTAPGPHLLSYYLGLAYLLSGDAARCQEIWMSALLEDDAEDAGRGLIEIMEAEIYNALDRSDLATVKILCGLILEIDESWGNEEIEREINKVIDSLEKAGQQALEVKNWPEAIEIYNRLLNWNNGVDAYWYRSALVYYHTRQYSLTTNALNAALNINDRVADYHYLMALTFERENNWELAVQAYNKTLELDDNYSAAYSNIGNLFYRIGELTKAQDCYEKAIEITPNSYVDHINLGNVLLAKQELSAAENIYQKALAIAPERSEATKNLELVKYLAGHPQRPIIYTGNFFFKNHHYSRAIQEYEKLVGSKVEDANYYTNFSQIYLRSKDYEKALSILNDGIKYHPGNSGLYLGKIWLLLDARPIQETLKFTELAAEIFPECLSFKLELMRLMPIVYKNQEEITYYRDKYINFLEEINQNIFLESEESKKDALKSIGLRTNFYLQYQGYNDLILQRKYGDLVGKIMRANYPQWLEPLPVPDLTEDGKIRVGYLSANIRAHTVAKLFFGWLKYSRREEFEIYCYATDIDKISDVYTEMYRRESDYFYQYDLSYKLEEICQLILKDKLHILVFLDIGMDARTGQLAGLRLAPIQCVTWGHPVTTGLSTVDYFISSELMEPEYFEEHYSEKVVRLPNLSIAYAFPNLPPVTEKRSKFNLAEDKIVYLSCQSLFKYLPKNDRIFSEIARRVPNCQLAFISHPSSYVTEVFKQRLEQVFQDVGLNWQDYVVILPKLNQMQYFQVNLLADIYLDNVGWSGGNTTLEAVACGLPIVTFPGELMRCRHSYAILKMLGVEETIASSVEEYINIAVRLGLDPQWREEVRQKVSANKYKVFDDRTTVEALENFYRSVVENGR